MNTKILVLVFAVAAIMVGGTMVIAAGVRYALTIPGSLTVVESPELTYGLTSNVSSLNFGPVYVGTSSIPHQVTVTNTGNTAIFIRLQSNSTLPTGVLMTIESSPGVAYSPTQVQPGDSVSVMVGISVDQTASPQTGINAGLTATAEDS